MIENNFKRVLLCALCACGDSAALAADGEVAETPAVESTKSPTDTARQNSSETGGLEEIIVTSRRREESLQSTPVAVTAITGASLESSHIIDVSDLSSQVPNTTIRQQAGFAGAIVAYIRGIGTQESLLSIDPAVGTYIDGVYVGGNYAANLELLDLDRIEVLRGPQGTLFGRNSTGGAINLVTRRPGDDFGVNIKLGTAEFHENVARIKVDTGEWGDSGIRASATYLRRTRDGYFNDPDLPDDRDPGWLALRAYSINLSGRWGGFSVEYSYDNTNQQDLIPPNQITAATPTVQNFVNQSPGFGGSTFYPISSQELKTYSSDHTTYQDFQSALISGHAITMQYVVSDALTVKSITGFRAYDGQSFQTYGVDGLLGTVIEGAGTAVAPVVLFAPQLPELRARQHSEELQALGDIERFSYVAGLFYYADHDQEVSTYYIPFILPPGDSALLLTQDNSYTSEARSQAAYGQVSYKQPLGGDTLELSLGSRYTEDHKILTQSFRAGNQEFHNLNWSTSVSYQPASQDFLVYGKVGTGYRSGGFNIRAAAGQNFLFEPEEVTSYEVGAKTELLDRHLRLNGAVFHTNYKDLQVTQFTGASGGVQPAAVKINGVELELTAVITDKLTVNFDAGYLHYKYSSIYFQNPVTGDLQNYASSSYLPDVPSFTGSIGPQYEFGTFEFGTLRAALDYSYNTQRHFFANAVANPFNDAIRDRGHGVLNGHISLAQIPLSRIRSKAEVSVWGKNLTNQEYRDIGVDFGSLGFASNIFGMPRQVGVEFVVSH